MEVTNIKLDAVLDNIIEKTERIPRSVDPLFWTNKVGSKLLGDKPKSVADVNTAERKKLAKTYKIGRTTQIHKRAGIIDSRDRREKNSRVSFLAGRSTLRAQRARKTPTLYLNKNEEIDALLDETIRLNEDARIDRLLSKPVFDISKFTDKDLERFVKRSKYKTEEEWKEAAKKRVMLARKAQWSPKGRTSNKNNELVEEIDSYLDETRRRARTEKKEIWDRDVQKRMETDGVTKRTANRRTRKDLAGILKRDRKEKGSWNYNYAKLNLQNSKKPK